jgi:hypothetical protein
MRALVTITAVVAMFVAMGCAQVDDLQTAQVDTISAVSGVVLDATGNAFTATVTYDDSKMTLEEAQLVLDNVGVTTDVDISVTGSDENPSVLDGFTSPYTELSASNPQWDMFDPAFDIQVLSSAADDIEHLAWDFVDPEVIVDLLCPPGHM